MRRAATTTCSARRRQTGTTRPRRASPWRCGRRPMRRSRASPKRVDRGRTRPPPASRHRVRDRRRTRPPHVSRRGVRTRRRTRPPRAPPRRARTRRRARRRHAPRRRPRDRAASRASACASSSAMGRARASSTSWPSRPSAPVQRRSRRSGRAGRRSAPSGSEAARAAPRAARAAGGRSRRARGPSAGPGRGAAFARPAARPQARRPVPVPRRDLEETRARLRAWLRARLPGAEISPLTGPAATGFSNDTLLFDAHWREGGRPRARALVCRLEPAGAGVFPRYDVAERFRVMHALRDTAVPVPAMLWLEPDPVPLGSPFFVMERVDGRIPTDTPPYHGGGWVAEITPAERRALWNAAVDALAEIHRQD